MGRRAFSRRSFLRGAGGLAVALPVLDAALNSHGTAYADGAALPCRYLFCFGGYSLGADNDSAPNGVTPTVIGPNYDLGAGLAPLAGYGGVKDSITVVSGLEVPAAGTGNTPLPAGVAGDDQFHWHHNPLLAGIRTNPGGFDATVTGPSSDQVAAAALGADTLFESLVYRAQALRYLTNVGGGNEDFRYLSHSSDGSPIPPTVSPRQAYEALFTNFVPDDPVEAAAKAAELAKRKSILDMVDRRASTLAGSLGTVDQQRVEAHLQFIRELEERIDAMPPDPGDNPACAPIPDPGDDPPLGGEAETYQEFDANAGYSGEDERLRVLADLMHMAFVCDLTRAGSLMFTMWQCDMSILQLTGSARSYHNAHHQGTTAECNEMIAWHMDHFGRLVALLRDTPEGAGSVLDNCAIVYANEGGHGRGHNLAEAPVWSSHSYEKMAWLVAGGAGGLRQGEHIIAPASASHPVNVVITALAAAGVNGDTHGEVTGLIDTLRS